MCSVMAVKAGLSLLMLMALPVAAQIQVAYFQIDGGTLRFIPHYPEAITSIVWKHKGNIVAEYIKDHVPLEYLGDLKGRTNLDLTTGILTVSNMRKSDDGLFTVEINNKVFPVSFKAVGIRRLDNYPVQVSVRPQGCSNRTSNNCTLVCGEEFEGAGPVEYFWRPGKRGEWKKGNQTLNFVFTKTSKSFSLYTCKVTNPISEKQSKPVESKPLQGSSGPVPLPAILLLAVLAVGAAVVL